MSDFQQTVNLKDKMKAQREQAERAAFLREEEKPKLLPKKKLIRKANSSALPKKSETAVAGNTSLPESKAGKLPFARATEDRPPFARATEDRPSFAKATDGKPPFARATEDRHDIDELFNVDREESVPGSVPTNIKKDLHQINRPIPREPSEGDDIYKKMSVILLVLLIGCLAYFLFFAKNGSDKQVVENIVPAWYAVKLVTGEIYYGEIGDTKADPVVVEKVYYDYDQLNGNSKSGAEGEAGNLRLVKRGKETHGPEGIMNIVRSQVLFMEPLKAESKVLKAILNYEK